MSERIDIVNAATGERLDTMSRAEVHEGGHWHQVFHCLVLRSSTNSIVLQERSMTKAAFPGKLDLSVTGHLSAGESPIEGIREAEEELGVQLDPRRLVPIGVRLLADDNGEGQNRERVHLFFLTDDRPISDYEPPANEVSALVEVGVGDFLAALGDPGLVVPCLRSEVGNAAINPSKLSQADLVEGSSGYWVTLGVMAERYLRGVKPIAI